MTDIIISDNEPPEFLIEFLNFTEIVNDVLSKLHSKDRTLLYHTDTLTKLYQIHPFWKVHIVHFYYLWHPENPITHKAIPSESAESIAARIMKTVWESVQHTDLQLS